MPIKKVHGWLWRRRRLELSAFEASCNPIDRYEIAELNLLIVEEMARLCALRMGYCAQPELPTPAQESEAR